MCQSSDVCGGGCLGFHKEYLILVQPTRIAMRLLGVFALQGARLMIREIKIYRCSLGCASEIPTWLCQRTRTGVQRAISKGQASPEGHI